MTDDPLDDLAADVTVDSAVLVAVRAVLAREANIAADAGDLDTARTLLAADKIIGERWERQRPMMYR